MSYLMIFIAAIFVNNIVLSQFLGICPFLGVSRKTSTALGMGFAVMFVMTISAIVTHLIYYQLLLPNQLTFMITVVFILVIASLVQMVEIIMHKTSPALYQALGIFLPLITTNCAVFRCCNFSNSKGFRPFILRSVTGWPTQWASLWQSSFCGHSRKDGNGSHSPSFARCADSFDCRRSALYVFLWAFPASAIKNKPRNSRGV